jgi:beta-xylosidase
MNTKRIIVFVLMILASNVKGASEFQLGDVWLDTNGKAIQAHGGGILVEGKKYYWYGEDRTIGRQSGVCCYSSTDLYNWKCEGVVFDVNSFPQDMRGNTFIERPKVIFNKQSSKYVLWMHLEQRGYRYSRAGIAISDKATGPFVFLKAIRPIQYDAGYKDDDLIQQKKLGGTYRDMNLFTDEDGKAYAFYASEDNATMYVVRLNEDYTGPQTPIEEGKTWARIMAGKMREAPAPFKYKGRYYLITSGCTGWTPNAAQWAQADNILGPWEIKSNPCTGEQADTTFQSQSTFVLPLAGKPGCFIFMADRWQPRRLSDSRYVWLPIIFTPDGNLKIEWKDKWDLSFFEKSSASD